MVSCYHYLKFATVLNNTVYMAYLIYIDALKIKLRKNILKKYVASIICYMEKNKINYLFNIILVMYMRNLMYIQQEGLSC